MERQVTIREDQDWNKSLSDAIDWWHPGDTIVVRTEIQKRIGVQAAEHRGKPDIKIVVEA